MVSLPGWGGPWERRERLGSNGSEISRFHNNRYNPVHPGVHETGWNKNLNYASGVPKVP